MDEGSTVTRIMVRCWEYIDYFCEYTWYIDYKNNLYFNSCTLPASIIYSHDIL